jgi:hypothetical protein
MESPATGARRRVVMSPAGTDQFRFLLQQLLEPITMRAIADDGRSSWKQIEIVEPPAVVSIEHTVRPPAYTRLTATTQPLANPNLAVPHGSELAMRVSINKPIDQIDARLDDKPMTTEHVDARTFTWRCVALGDSRVEWNVVDVDGVDLAEPFRVTITAVPDQPPQVFARPSGVSSYVTPQAEVPLNVSAEDDYGLARIDLERTIDPSPAQWVPVLSSPTEEPRWESQQRVDLLPYQLAPGSKLTLVAVATDTDDLSGPHQGRSEPIHLEIISDEEFLSRLAERELDQRQRFEQVIEELRAAGRGLASLRSAGGEATEDSRRLAIDRSVGALRKDAGETESIAAAFDAILAELINNRVANTTILDRLRGSIVEPLAALLAGPFPSALARCQELDPKTDHPSFDAQSREAENAIDQLIAQAETILEAMRKLESFQEVVASLRSIMDDQQALREATKKSQRQKVLDLLRE